MSFYKSCCKSCFRKLRQSFVTYEATGVLKKVKLCYLCHQKHKQNKDCNMWCVPVASAGVLACVMFEESPIIPSPPLLSRPLFMRRPHGSE